MRPMCQRFVSFRFAFNVANQLLYHVSCFNANISTIICEVFNFSVNAIKMIEQDERDEKASSSAHTVLANLLFNNTDLV